MAGDLIHCLRAREEIGYRQAVTMAFFSNMTFFSKLNRFERVLFVLAIALGTLVAVLRVGTFSVLWFLHHS